MADGNGQPQAHNAPDAEITCTRLPLPQPTSNAHIRGKRSRTLAWPHAAGYSLAVLLLLLNAFVLQP